MRARLLSGWAGIAARRPLWVVLGALLFTLLCGWLARDMKVSSRWSDMLPSHDPSVEELDRILKEFVTISNSIVVLQGSEDEIKAVADELAPQIRRMHHSYDYSGFVDALEYVDEDAWERVSAAFNSGDLEPLREYIASRPEIRFAGDSIIANDVDRVYYKLEGVERRFYEEHALMLTKKRYLEDMPKIYDDLSLLPFLTHINDNFERVYTGDEESLSSVEKENEAVRSLDGVEEWVRTLKSYLESPQTPSSATASRAVDRLTLGDPYLVSPDKRTLMMMVEPRISFLDIDRVVAHVDSLNALVGREVAGHPNIRYGLTGSYPLQRDEMTYSLRDMKVTGLLGTVLVLTLFILAFRMISAPFLAVMNVILGIIWTVGLASLVLPRLNMMTSFFGVILVGLGIDFSVHILSLYNESRQAGMTIADSLRATLHKAGAGVIVGALTTACAFLTLMISDTRGIAEMGAILGIGIICTMLASILVFPAVLTIRESILKRFRKREPTTHVVAVPLLGAVAGRMSRKPLLFLAGGILLTAFFLYNAFHVKFQYNYYALEPKGIPSVTLQDSLIKEFNMVSDPVLVTVDNPDRAREIAEQARELALVGWVESISDFLPSGEQQARRRPYIEAVHSNLLRNREPRAIARGDIGALAEQLERLDMNIYELGQMAFVGGQDRVDRKVRGIVGDPDNPDDRGLITPLVDSVNADPARAAERLSRFQRDYFPILRERSLRMANPAPIKFTELPGEIRRRFMNHDGSRMLVSIYPRQSVYNLQILDRIYAEMNRLDPAITGMPIMFKRMVELIGADGRRATLLTLLVVFLLLWVDFRRLRTALLGMIPLVVGVIWMIGVMRLVGMKFDIVNVIAIPMIIGIGIDDAVHILHRWRIEGDGRVEVIFRSTGRAILLTSLTTMCAFGSLMIASYRGLASMGGLLFIGVGTCFLTTILFLPPLLGLGRARREHG